MEEDYNNIREEDLHFHYKREDRLQRAPQIVKAHYDGTEQQPPKGFFKSLVHTKNSRFLLGSIVLLVIMILFATNIDITGRSGNIQNTRFELSAFFFEEDVFITVKAHTSPITEDIPISVYYRSLTEEDIIVEQSSVHSIFDGNENFFRTTLEKYDIIYVECDVSLGDETIQLRTKVQE